MSEPMDAVVLAGGRISGPYALAAGTTIKALAPIRGLPCVRHVVEALRAAPGVRRICVVGPEPVREALPDGCHWQDETPSALGNVCAGIGRLDAERARRVLLCGSDVPMVDAASLQDFLDRLPEDAEVCLPLVPRERFQATFPGCENRYVPLVEGAFTAGSQYVIHPEPLLRNRALLSGLFSRRKSQLGMARILGVELAWRLLTRRLAVPHVEARASRLTGCRCRAVPDCRAELAFDIDNLPEWRYAEQWQPGRRSVASL